MGKITKEQYEFALARIVEWLPVVDDNGISPSRISDYISERAEPTLKIARMLCLTLGITPAAMLGF